MNKTDTLNIIKYYSSLYMKEQFFLVSIITLPISVIFFVVSLYFDVISYDIFVSFTPILFGALVLFFAYLKTNRFKNMIFLQEKVLNVSFDNEKLYPIYPKTLFYFSNSWFIKSGCWAFHKSYLNSIKVLLVNEKNPSMHYIVKLYTVEGYVITDHSMHSGEIKKMKAWYNG